MAEDTKAQVETPVKSLVTIIDSTVAKRSVSGSFRGLETVVSQGACDSTVATVVNLAEIRQKKARDTTVLKNGKRSVSKAEPAPKPKAIRGHEWRRQGSGWTLLRSWYERDENGERARRREYVQHYSATALRRAETLRRKVL